MRFKRIYFKPVPQERVPLVVFLSFFALFILARVNTFLPDQAIRNRVIESENGKLTAMMAAQGEMRKRQKLTEAIKFYNEKNYKDAERILLALASEDPQNREALRLYREEKYKEAKEFFQQLAAEESQHSKTREVLEYLQKVANYYYKVNWSDSIARREREKHEKMVTQILQKVDNFWKNGDYYLAMCQLEDPAVVDKRLYSKKADLRKKWNRIKARRREDARIAAEKKRLVKKQFFKATEAFSKKNYPRALSFLNEVIRVDIDTVEHEKALELLSEYRQKNENWAKQRLKNGDTAMARKKYRVAYRYYLGLYKIFPNNTEVLQRIDKVTPELLKISERHYKNGNAYQGMNMLDKARREYELAISYSPNRTNELYKKALKKLRKITGR